MPKSVRRVSTDAPVTPANMPSLNSAIFDIKSSSEESDDDDDEDDSSESQNKSEQSGSSDGVRKIP